MAYIHYVQGAFTALISAFCALLATLIAFGYYEKVFGLVPAGGKFIDLAPGMILIALFAASYLVLRIIFDSVAPGNLRLPAVGDKAGGAVFGLIAGLFGSGVLAVGAQMLPFGPSIGGFTRYDLEDRPVVIPGKAVGRTSDVDTALSNQLKDASIQGNAFNPSAAGGLLVPSDSFVISVARMASDGPFQGAYAMTSLHPDLLTELFANRLGAEPGTGRVATSKTPPASITGIFTVASPKAADVELTKLRPGESALTFKPAAGDVLVAFRLKFEATAADPDGHVRLTPGAARLFLGNRTYYPIGALGAEPQIGLTRLDDMIIVPLKGEYNSADLVYSIDKATFDRVAPNSAFKPDAGFLQIKLLTRLPVTGKVSPWTAGKSSYVLQKPLSPLGVATGGGGATP